VADTVSLTSCDSNDSTQSSTLSTQAPVRESSSSSTVSEDCSSESGHCKSPLLMVSIDFELLRKDDAILELVSRPAQHSPAKLLPDSDTESTADVTSGITDNAADADSTENSTMTHNDDIKVLDIVDQSLVVYDEDFESIYSPKLAIPTAEMSLDDAIICSLMDSRANDFRDVVQPVVFNEFPGHEPDSDNHTSVRPASEQVPIPRQMTILQSTSNSDDIVSHTQSLVGTRQSVVNNWVQLPAPANIRSLSVSSRHIWCVDMSGQVLYSPLHGPGLRWFVVTTAPAQQVSVSPSGSLVWRLDGRTVYAARNVTARQPWGNKWSAVARDVTWISADDHVAW